MAYLTGSIKDDEPALTEALGVVFLCGGIATWLNVSLILTAMILGTGVANLHVITTVFDFILCCQR
ncbi:MAG: hypothetical protein MRJ65_13740 [Candidatus Brocadiaceae bacterium]|nr:hypothetical protein [Candidatus Brocadiaceae bacterium]